MKSKIFKLGIIITLLILLINFISFENNEKITNESNSVFKNEETYEKVNSESESVSKEKEINYEEEYSYIKDNKDMINSKYAELLNDIHDNPTKYIENMEKNEDIEDDKFAIVDINQDGINELIVSFVEACGIYPHTGIWTFDSSSKSIIECANIGETYEYFSNGVIKIPLNSYYFYGKTISPYNLVKYDEISKKYISFAEVSCADSEIDTSEKFYSTEKDLDNDGVIYYFKVDGEEAKPLTLEEYSELVKKYVPEEKKIEIEWYKLTNENINKFAGKNNLELEGDKTNKESWQSKFISYINKSTSFALYDINKDSIPELISDNKVYMISENDIKMIGEINTISIYKSKKDNSFYTMHSAGSFSASVSEYTIENEELKFNSILTYSKNEGYKKEGVEISQSEWQNLADELLSNGKINIYYVKDISNLTEDDLEKYITK